MGASLLALAKSIYYAISGMTKAEDMASIPRKGQGGVKGERDRERRTRMKVLARIAAFSFPIKRLPSLIFRRSRSLAFTYASTYSLVAHEQAAGASETL